MGEMCFQNIRCLVRTPKDFDPAKKYPVLHFEHDEPSDAHVSQFPIFDEHVGQVPLLK